MKEEIIAVLAIIVGALLMYLGFTCIFLAPIIS